MNGISTARVAQRREGVRPLVGRKFRFSCHKGIACFTACCADLHLILTPYDILRMKNRLGISAGPFIETYTVQETADASPFPLLRLRMASTEKKPCPFVTQEGCSIYEDRPGACRLYPLGRAAFLDVSADQALEQYFIVDESHCLGFQEKREWAIKTWIHDQGVDLYNEMNRPWMEIMTTSNPLKKRLDERKLQMFFMVSYNLDRFRDFVFQSKFLRVFRLWPRELARIHHDESELMKLGMKWLRFALYGEDALDLIK